MIKVRNQKILEYETVKALNEELFLQEFFGALLGCDIKLGNRSNCSAADCPEINDMYLLKNEEDLCIYFNFSEFLPVQDALQHYMKLIDYSASLRKNQEASSLLRGFVFSDPLNKSSEIEYWKYEIAGAGVNNGSVVVACPQNFSFFYCDSVNRAEQLQTEVVGQGKIKLMLGQIELDLGEFMKLKEGMQIECDLPEGFSACLDFGNEKFAGVNAQMDGQKLRLTVTNLATS